MSLKANGDTGIRGHDVERGRENIWSETRTQPQWPERAALLGSPNIHLPKANQLDESDNHSSQKSPVSVWVVTNYVPFRVGIET